MAAYLNVEDYLSAAPEEGRRSYERLLAVVLSNAPDATVRLPSLSG